MLRILPDQIPKELWDLGSVGQIMSLTCCALPTERIPKGDIIFDKPNASLTRRLCLEARLQPFDP
jgi:hypothetical protein